MSAESLKKEFVPKYLSNGEQKFYRFLLVYAINKLMLIEKGINTASPELELLEASGQFLTLYRREGDVVYLDLAKIFRKAAHKIYFMMLKKKMTPRNAKFLNLVQ